ncbi:MAG: sugar-binding protein [Lentisphaeria bacterium]|jgi:TolB protein|nr:sugar-binding protein [Lentisphaeria bacterium]
MKLETENVKLRSRLCSDGYGILWLPALLAIALSAAASGDRSYEIPRAPAEMKIDGALSEWANVAPFVIDPSADKVCSLYPQNRAWNGARDCSAAIWLAWDKVNLYLAADVIDDMPLRDNIFARDQAPWLSDSIEIWLGAAGADKRTRRTENDYKLCLTTRREGDLKVAGWLKPEQVEQLEVALTRTDNGYRVEARMPFVLFPSIATETGAELGLNVHVNDADESGTAESVLSWSNDPDSKSFKRPNLWGKATLVDTQSNAAEAVKDWTERTSEMPGWRKLTTLGGREPALSPGGKTVCFVRFVDGKNNLWLVSVDGGEEKQLTDEGAIQPAWSPDGKTIAFASERTGRDCLWLIEAASKNLRQLTNNGTGDSFPDFSPDGRTIAFNRYQKGWRVLQVPTGGGDVSPLVDTVGARHPDWSSDGTEITYAWRESDHVKTEIWIESIAGGEKRQVSYDTMNQGTRQPAWSPDGKWVVYVETTMQPDCRLSVVTSQGKEKYRAADEYHELFDFPGWSPDGKSVVCSSKRDATIENIWILPSGR